MLRSLAKITIALTGVVLLAVWAIFPWGAIEGVGIERAEAVTIHDEGEETRRGIAVTFLTRDDLDAVRRRKGADFVTAVLSDCDDGDAAQRIAVSQGAGYFQEGKVVALGSTISGSHRYRATFGDWLPDGNGPTRPAMEDRRLCFSLGGGSMWMGMLWSDRLPLTISERS